ncbi:DinB family protein [Tsukamurella sp. 1534]|uniref:DinB family protein n=1 Tax=Tsukamurella sp. 1534 TaxID=1151061 RepID=UPI000300B979|nr:DinB family protein [Tsukamurella sp. 1534]
MPASEGQIAAFLSVAAETLDTVDRVLGDCDDTTVNAVPPVPGVNSVFALVTHVAGALGYWGGSLLAGEDIPRDRASEFHATGTVDEAHAIVARLRVDLPRWDPVAANGIRNPEATGTTRRNAATATPEWVLTHMLRELTQHTGHMEICRDVVARRADRPC